MTSFSQGRDSGREQPTMTHIPNLAALALHPRRALVPDAPDGVYCLDSLDDVSRCDSSVVVVRNALPLSAEETRELDAYMADDERVPRTPNPMNTNTFLLRKHCTFGAAYDFGQANAAIPGPPSGWPVAVQRALAMAQDLAEQKGLEREMYNAVHTNRYPHGRAGVAPHADSERDMVRGLPIYSFTLLAGNRMPRPFSIYLPKMPGQKDPEKIADIVLGHGDLVVMQGRMQQAFLHGVPAAKPPKAYANAVRINMTVRAFKEEAVAGRGHCDGIDQRDKSDEGGGKRPRA